MFKHLILALACLIALNALPARVKPLSFADPGNRRLLKTEAGNYWYYRSQPERSMTLNVEGISAIHLRSFGLEELRRPQVISIIGGERRTWDLNLKEIQEGYYLYDEINIPIPPDTQSMEILCYERGIYFRPFHTVEPAPRPRPSRPDNLVVNAHGGVINISHNGTDSPYYVFNASQPLRFTLNNGRAAVIYVRARLLDRSLPEFEIYRDGVLLDSREFSLRRTTTYKAVGVDHLTTGMRIELTENSGSAVIELRAISDHMFFARPLARRAD